MTNFQNPLVSGQQSAQQLYSDTAFTPGLTATTPVSSAGEWTAIKVFIQSTAVGSAYFVTLDWLQDEGGTIVNATEVITFNQNVAIYFGVHVVQGPYFRFTFGRISGAASPSFKVNAFGLRQWVSPDRITNGYRLFRVAQVINAGATQQWAGTPISNWPIIMGWNMSAVGCTVALQRLQSTGTFTQETKYTVNATNQVASYRDVISYQEILVEVNNPTAGAITYDLWLKSVD